MKDNFIFNIILGVMIVVVSYNIYLVEERRKALEEVVTGAQEILAVQYKTFKEIESLISSNTQEIETLKEKPNEYQKDKEEIKKILTLHSNAFRAMAQWAKRVNRHINEHNRT